MVVPVFASTGRAPVPRIAVIDDDQRVRDGLENLLASAGYEVELYPSTFDYLAARRQSQPNCLVLDIRLRAESGLDFQKSLVDGGSTVPIVLITGHGDVPMTVRAMRQGAVDVLAKPFRPDELLTAVATAVRLDGEQKERATANAVLVERYNQLSAREREVMRYVVAGLMNKQIAGRLGLSEVTVKIHRGSAMRKMEAASLPDLVRMSEALGLEPAEAARFQTPRAG